MTEPFRPTPTQTEPFRATRTLRADQSAESVRRSYEHRAGAPVFVDVTGRRRAIVRHVVIVLGLALAAYLGVVGVGLLVGAEAPLAPWPGTTHRGPEAGDDHPTTRSTRAPVKRPAARTTAPRPTTEAPAPTSTPQPTPTVSHPGKSHATPPANGRTKSPPGRGP